MKSREYWRKIAATILAAAFALPAHGATAWIRQFADRVLGQGAATAIPPHMSLVFGLGSGEDPFPVRQFVMRDSADVRIFDVAKTDGKRVLVLINYNEKTRFTEAFLVRADGALQKAINFEAGAQPMLMSATQGRAAFAKTLEYWKVAAR